MLVAAVAQEVNGAAGLALLGRTYCTGFATTCTDVVTLRPDGKVSLYARKITAYVPPAAQACETTGRLLTTVPSPNSQRLALTLPLIRATNSSWKPMAALV